MARREDILCETGGCSREVRGPSRLFLTYITKMGNYHFLSEFMLRFVISFAKYLVILHPLWQWLRAALKMRRNR